MKRIFGFTILLLLINYAHAQTGLRLQGTVKDASGKPLPFASVFLNQTTMGARTTEEGTFVIPNVPPGRYEVIASYLGFEPLMQPVNLEADRTMAIVLQQKPGALKELVVRPDKDREYYLRLFKDIFIGQGAFAKNCKLLNPDLVDFEFDPQLRQLKAKADDFLEIANASLGYNIRFLLIHFEYNSGTGYSMYYGNPLFEPMKARSRSQQKRWEKNREKAYHGSTVHFYRSLVAGSLKLEGFTIRKLMRRTRERNSVINAPADSAMGILPNKRLFSNSVSYLSKQELPADSVFRKDSTDFVLHFNEHLYVVYGNEKEERLYLEKQQRGNDKPGAQVSLMKLLEPEVRLDRNGNLEAPMNVIFEQYWAWEKLAEMLPLNYRL